MNTARVSNRPTAIRRSVRNRAGTARSVGGSTSTHNTATVARGRSAQARLSRNADAREEVITRMRATAQSRRARRHELQLESRRIQEMIDNGEEIAIEPPSDDDIYVEGEPVIGHRGYALDSFVVEESDSDLDIESDGDSLLDSDFANSSVEEDVIFAPNPEDESADEDDKITLADEPDDPDVIRSSEHGHCTICFDDSPAEPQGCLICRQLIGCKKCVMGWYQSGVNKRNKRRSDANNHFQCPLCRHEWENEPEIDSIFLLDA